MDFYGVEAPPPFDGLEPEDIKFLRSLRTSATGPSSDGEAGERLGGIARRLSSRTVKKLGRRLRRRRARRHEHDAVRWPRPLVA